MINLSSSQVTSLAALGCAFSGPFADFISSFEQAVEQYDNTKIANIVVIFVLLIFIRGIRL